MARRRAEHPRDTFATFRLTGVERAEMEQQARRRGFPSLSEYVRSLHQENKRKDAAVNSPTKYPAAKPTVAFQTPRGQALQGDALSYLFGVAGPKSVDLIMTPPPFGLVRKK